MGNSALLWHVLSDAAAVTASNEDSATPADFIQNALVSRVWRTQVSVSTASIKVDFGAPAAIDTIGLFGLLISASATVQIKASAVDPDGSSDVYDSGVLAAFNPFKSFPHYPTAAQTARYWNIAIISPGSSFIEVGRLIMGLSLKPGRSFSYGMSRDINRVSEISISAGGQQWENNQYDQRVWSLDYRALTEAEWLENFEDIRANGGQHRDLMICANTGSEDLPRDTLLGTWDNPQFLRNAGFSRYETAVVIRGRR